MFCLTLFALLVFAQTDGQFQLNEHHSDAGDETVQLVTMLSVCTVYACSVPVSLLVTTPSATAAAAAAERSAHKPRHPPPDIHPPRVGSTFLFLFKLILELSCKSA